MSKKISLFFIALLLYSICASQTSKQQIYDCYIAGDMATWLSIIDKMQNLSDKTSDEYLELVNYQYGYTAWCLGCKRYTEAEDYLHKAESNLEKVKISGKYQSEVHSYTAAFTGFKIAINKYKAPILGSVCEEHAEKAVRLNKNNPFGFVEMGNIKLHMPSIFGGSSSDAILYYTAALTLMERSDIYTKYNWNYLNTMVLLARAYSESENFEQAEFYYKKLLRMEPDFTWVKNTLYPELRRKMSQ